MRSHEASKCPVCSGRLNVLGTRSRTLIDSSGAQAAIYIRRLRCVQCGRIHHELPDMVMPYKRHCTETIEKILGGEEEETCCESSTIARIKAWWSELRLYFTSVLESLTEKYAVKFESPTPIEVVRAVANAHLWTHTRSAFLSG